MRTITKPIVGAATALALLLPACDGDTPAQQMAVAELASAGDSDVQGEATLLWDPESETLVTTITLDGLESDATYMAVIAPGCGTGTGRVHVLGSIVGAADGSGTATVELEDVTEVDLDGGWAVKIGRQSAGQQACGVVEPA